MKKRDLFFRFLMSFLFGLTIAVGNLFCIATAFVIPIDGSLLFIICIFSALACSIVHMFDRALAVRLIIFAAALLMFLMVNWEAVKNGYLLTYRIMLEWFIKAYDITGNIHMPDAVPYGTQATMFMALVGAVLSFITAWTVSRRSRLWVLGIVSVPLFYICLIIIDAPPAVWPVLLLTGTYVLLLVTQSRRRLSAGGNHAVTLCLILPVALLIIGLANHVDPQSYVRSDWMERVRDNFKQTVERHSIVQRNEDTGEWEFISPFIKDTLGSFIWNSNMDETDLSAVGPQRETNLPVMAVYSDEDETFYLKGNSFAIYEDNSWKALDDDAYLGVPITDRMWLTDTFSEHEVKIKTNSRSSILYLPYVPTELPENAEIFYDEYVKNSGNLTSYSVPSAEDAPFAMMRSNSGENVSDYKGFVYDTYTQVPDETKAELAATLNDVEELILRESGLGNQSSIAHIVAYYVRTSATYSLETERMPDGDDFVRWFLQDSETGYCVHFATAATVLLRCMDIPARYVCGYKVTTNAGQWTTVTQDEAHAWVEYYEDGFGWRILEATPSAPDAEYEQENGEMDNSNENSEQDKDQTEPSDNFALPGVLPGPGSGGGTGKTSYVVAGLGTVLAFALFVFVWSVVVRKLRRMFLTAGPPNRRTIAYYYHLKFMAKLLKENVPDFVNDLALKARFSQHTISNDELAKLANLAEKMTATLRSNRKPIYYMLYRFVFAL